MQTYIIRRLLLAIPTLLVVSIVSFAVVNFMPGNFITSRLLESPAFKKEDIAVLEHRLGLDKPVYERYWTWLTGAVHGDLGKSLYSSKPARGEIGSRLPVTLELAVIAFIFALLVSIIIGIISAVRQDTPLDYGLRFLAIAGLSIPSFWIGTLFIVAGVRWFHYVPQLKFVPFPKDPVANIKQFLVPSLILAIALSASLMRMTRSSMLEVLRQDYIRTAWSKGFPEQTIIRRHAVRNALIPVLTIAGAQLAALLSGSVIIEQIFNLPGLGNLLLVAVQQRDFIIVQAVTIFLAALLVMLNIVIDVAYGLIDPRIKY